MLVKVKLIVEFEGEPAGTEKVVDAARAEKWRADSIAEIVAPVASLTLDAET